MLPVYALLHDIMIPGWGPPLALAMFLGVGFLFACIGVHISRTYGPATLALSTGAFCFVLMVLWGTSIRGEPGGLILVPIAGGIAQGIVIGRRTRDGKGRALTTEALIGSGVFAAATVGAALVAAVVLT